MEPLPDLGSLSDDQLKQLIDDLTREEQEVSYRRRILHGKIDILRAELVNRLKVKRETGESALTGADVQQLTDILLGKVPAIHRLEQIRELLPFRIKPEIERRANFAARIRCHPIARFIVEPR